MSEAVEHVHPDMLPCLAGCPAYGTRQGPLGGVTFVGSDDDAYRFIASVSWPLERQENRDSWAVTMRHRPDLLASEIQQARARLEAAIERVLPPGAAS